MNKERLLKLAEHLEHGELSVDQFDFAVYRAHIQGCGTAGCALGECQDLFGEEFFKSAKPGLDIFLRAACGFFDLTIKEARNLFYPKCQDPAAHGGGVQILKETATREEVAAHIRSFVANKEIL